jgi:hypothetical protein
MQVRNDTTDTEPQASQVDELPWWEKPYRIVQTNLRLTDADLDPDILAAEVRDFGATALTFNVGGIFAFYPTELELQARNPRLNGDLTGDMLASAHRAGLRLVGRYDLSKGTKLAYDAHPDWFVHNASGQPQEYNGTYQACVNGGWAKDYSLQILRESLSRYDLDGVFFNMTGYQPVDYGGNYRGICWCQNCQDTFGEMFRRELPRREDFSDPAFADYLLFKERTSSEASQRLYDTVKSVRRRTGVMGSGRGACDFMRLELQRAVRRPPPEWPHQAGELTRWAAAFGRGKPYACASTNFLDFNWRFASETSAHHMLRFGQQIAGGAQIDYYVLGTLDQDNAEPIAPVREFMHWHAANERYLAGTTSLAKVALYHSRSTILHAGATATGAQQTSGFRGAYRALLEARIPFGYISDERMADLDVTEQLARYDVIVLSNVSCLSNVEAEALDTFVANGGALIATGETGLYDERGNLRNSYALTSFPVAKPPRYRPDLETYFEVNAEDLDLPNTRLLHLHGWYFETDPSPECGKLLRLLPSPKYGPPELCFPEHPPTDHPGVVVGRFGRGQVLYLPWLPEWLYQRDGLPEHRELIAQLVGRNSPPLLKLTGAGPVEVTVRTTDLDPGELIIHIVNYAGQRGSAYEEPPVIKGLRLGVLNAGGAGRALVARTGIDLGETDPEGYDWLDVPDVKYFETIVLPRRTH